MRRAQIGRRRRVLEIGAGYGLVTRELVRRAGGEVYCLDLRVSHGVPPQARAVAGDACDLPFREAAFDLVFCQNVLMWVGSIERAVTQAARVLEPGGVLVAIEPDYGGMIEYPATIALKDLWVEGLLAAGADPEAGRRIPVSCAQAGLEPWVELQNIPAPPSPDAPRLLQGLPLGEDQKARAEAVARALEQMERPWDAFIHVPYVLVVATKP